MATLTAKNDPSNAAKPDVDLTRPFIARLSITGAADFLFHRWNCEAVEEKGRGPKGSAIKKTDNVESYVARNDDGLICLPGTYLRGSIINAAKFRQDPRSPRKSAMDLFKAGIVVLTELAPFGPDPKPTWDYAHSSRVQVQRAGITRVRPAFKTGWTATFDFAVLLPQYISPQILHETANEAGRLVGVGDFRPTYGRFLVSRFDVVAEP